MLVKETPFLSNHLGLGPSGEAWCEKSPDHSSCPYSVPWQVWSAEKVYEDLPHLQESQGKPPSMFLLGSTHSKLPSYKLSQLICHWNKLSRKMTMGVPSPGSVHFMNLPRTAVGTAWSVVCVALSMLSSNLVARSGVWLCTLLSHCSISWPVSA